MSSGDARRRVEDEVTEADDESEVISVGGPLSIVGGESEVSHLKKQSGGLVSFQRQRLHWILLDYQFVSFQTSQYPLTSC